MSEMLYAACPACTGSGTISTQHGLQACMVCEPLRVVSVGVTVAQIERLVAKEEVIGPTGEFPHGTIRPGDRGELKAALYIKGDKLILEFGTSLSWLAMTAEDASGLGRVLLEKAELVRKEQPT